MRIAHVRANAVTVTATTQELSALIAGARLAVALMAADPQAPAEARALRDLLERVLADYDSGLSRARNGGSACTSRSSPSTSPT